MSKSFEVWGDACHPFRKGIQLSFPMSNRHTVFKVLEETINPECMAKLFAPLE
jgi:hypothetical protein